MKAKSPTTSPVRQLISEARIQEILSSRRSISSEEAYREMEKHLGRPRLPGRKPVSLNGQTAWVSCRARRPPMRRIRPSEPMFLQRGPE